MDKYEIQKTLGKGNLGWS